MYVWLQNYCYLNLSNSAFWPLDLIMPLEWKALFNLCVSQEDICVCKYGCHSVYYLKDKSIELWDSNLGVFLPIVRGINLDHRERVFPRGWWALPRLPREWTLPRGCQSSSSVWIMIPRMLRVGLLVCLCSTRSWTQSLWVLWETERIHVLLSEFFFLGFWGLFQFRTFCVSPHNLPFYLW